jgi:hypothetical protein
MELSIYSVSIGPGVIYVDSFIDKSLFIKLLYLEELNGYDLLTSPNEISFKDKSGSLLME